MVNFNKNRAGFHKRRAVSTIVGAAIFLVLFASASSTFFIAMDVQRDTINTQRLVSDSIMEKSKEKFSIAVATDETNNNRLGIQVKNLGTNPVEIDDIWIVNKSGNFPAKKYLIDYKDSVIPPGYGSNILESITLTMLPDDYDIKVVSTLGTIEKSELTVGGNNHLLAELFAIPPDVRQGENVTIALRITNVGPTKILGVIPDNLLLDDALPPHVQVSNIEEVLTGPIELNPSESTIFSWQVTLKNSATIGTKVKFSNFATGIESVTGFTVTSNTAFDKIMIRDPQGGSGEEIVIKDELFARPDIFMIIPNNFGDSNQQALWGITVANPTDAIMYVSKITTSVLFAGANDNQKIFDTPCPHTNIAPATDYWDCPNQNQLVWYDNTAPYYVQAIPPRSAYTFLLTLQPGAIVGPTEGLDSVVLHTAIFTTLGAFGESKWTTSMDDDTAPLVNVYLSTVAESTNAANMRGSRLGIPSGSTQTFNINIAELNTVSESIKAGAQLIINIPKDWQVILPLNSYNGFNVSPTVTVFPDDSSQIVGVLSADLLSGAKTIQFNAIAPTVSCEKMYVMHVLANGVTNNNRPIGPIGEIILQVLPAGACPP